MYKIINEDLFAYSVSDGINPKTEQSYSRLRIFNSNKLVRNVDENGNPIPRPSADSNERPISSGRFNPITREILRVTAPTDAFDDYKIAMSVKAREDNPNAIAVNLYGHDDPNKRDRNVFIIAFPFNGMLKAIPAAKDYRIYKGMIVSSSKPFWYQNRKFRKVLYLVVEPYFRTGQTTEVTLTAEFFALFKDRTDNDIQKTQHDVHCVTFYPPTEENPIVDYAYVCEPEVIDQPVIMELCNAEALWVTYRNDDQRSASGYRRSDNDGQRRSDNNRHSNGYRPNNNGNRSYTKAPAEKKDPLTDLDKMIQTSGMYDTNRRYKEEANGARRPSNGKKNRNR